MAIELLANFLITLALVWLTAEILNAIWVRDYFRDHPEDSSCGLIDDPILGPIAWYEQDHVAHNVRVREDRTPSPNHSSTNPIPPDPPNVHLNSPLFNSDSAEWRKAKMAYREAVIKESEK